ncbi:CPBP family intramembrane glutamic endopeptidase [Streptococcus ovis]|uniref:CPBP family intramembrane glutamic endopeptidase n=1 Tax=Streptococcus ovis TaxID=82806 RepID=UPI000375C822|nr:type II CAAX endopeptidase family protein [Streptococcus ovis]
MKKDQVTLASLTGFVLFVSIYAKSIVLNFFLGSASDTVFYMGQILIELCIVAISIYIIKGLGKQNVLQFRKPRLGYMALVLFCYVLVIFWNGIGSVLFPVTQNQQITESIIGSSDTVVISLLLMVIAAPIYEELVFRALVMTWLETWQTYYIDVLVSSSLFALLHVMDKGLLLTDFIHYFVLGLIFSLLYRKTNRLVCSLALHFLINFISWLILTFIYG